MIPSSLGVPLNPPDQPFLDLGGQRIVFLLIHPHHLLLVGDDPGLDGRGARFIDDQTVGVYPAALELPEKTLSHPVRSDDPGQDHLGPQSQEVVHHVGRPAQQITFLLHLHHRNRGFRGYPRDLPPDELVHHHIPYHQDAAVGKDFQGLQVRIGFLVHYWLQKSTPQLRPVRPDLFFAPNTIRWEPGSQDVPHRHYPETCTPVQESRIRA